MDWQLPLGRHGFGFPVINGACQGGWAARSKVETVRRPAMTRFLLILTVAAMMFAACPPRFEVGESVAGGATQAAAYHSELARLAAATAAMRQAAQSPGLEFPEPRPEMLFPVGR
jgi:hypothetical protein